MSRVIFGPGTCTRNSWMSPRPRSSSSITSLSLSSAGTSFWIEATACSINALVSAVDIRRAILAAVWNRFHVSDASAPRIEQRLLRDLALDPLAEHLDLHRAAGDSLDRGEVGVGDRAVDGVAIAAAGDAAGDAPAGAD